MALINLAQIRLARQMRKALSDDQEGELLDQASHSKLGPTAAAALNAALLLVAGKQPEGSRLSDDAVFSAVVQELDHNRLPVLSSRTATPKKPDTNETLPNSLRTALDDIIWRAHIAKKVEYVPGQKINETVTGYALSCRAVSKGESTALIHGKVVPTTQKETDERRKEIMDMLGQRLGQSTVNRIQKAVKQSLADEKSQGEGRDGNTR